MKFVVTSVLPFPSHRTAKLDHVKKIILFTNLNILGDLLCLQKFIIMLSHLNRVASHQPIIISSLPPFHRRWFHVFVCVVELTVIFFGQKEIIHGYAQAVIFALQVTLEGIGDCQALKHMTLKNLVMDDIVIDGELEVLISYCFLCLSRWGQIEYKQHDLEILYDAHSNSTINVNKKKMLDYFI